MVGSKQEAGETNQDNKQGDDWEQVREKNRKWQRAGGGGVSGHKQKTQGMTKQTQGAHDTLKQTQETHGYQGPVRRSSFSELPRSFSG